MMFCILVLARRCGVLWRSSKHEALRALAEHPCLIRSIFGRAYAELNWPLPVIDTKEASHGMFMGIARIEIAGERLAAVSAWLPHKDLAVSGAALSLLGIISGLSDMLAEENLRTYTASCGLRTPRYSISRCAGGARPFRCVAETNAPFAKNGTMAIAYAATEDEASERAASALLARLVFESV